MATVSQSPFDAYRTNTTAWLQIMLLGQQWRESCVALQQRRIARDQAALRGALEALHNAHDWNDLAASSQTVLRDYLSASATVWQEGMNATMRGAGMLSDNTRETLQKWLETWSGWQQGAAGGGAAAQHMREWMTAFERAVAGTGMTDSDAKNKAGNKAGKTTATSSGD